MNELQSRCFVSTLRFVFAVLFSLASSGAIHQVIAEDPAEDPVDYLSDIKPLLRDKCFSCHGALKQEGGLRLDAASLIRKGGDSGPAYVVGSADQSDLLQRVTDSDDNRMPPEDEGARLTAEEVAKLAAWIKAGAPTPEESIPAHPSQHWSFQPPVHVEVPNVSADWIHSDLDRFLVAEQLRVGVTAVGETSRSMLLRRAFLALTGLPPTPEQLRAFLDDTSDRAFEHAVDRLLESPRYGERWGRHFMDIWRYSDPSGYGDEIRDGRKHLWRWRDWIVESLNEDKGYDRMIVEMLAADEVAPVDHDALRATGFLARNWYKFNRNVWLDNIVEHSSKAFLGMTMNCVRCHDHKYDPLAHDDYYRMRAIFETHDVRDDLLPRASGANDEMFVRVYDAHVDRKTYTFLQGDENRPTEDPLEPGVPELLGDLSIEPVQLPVAAWYPAITPENHAALVRAAQAKLVAAEATLKQARADHVAAKQTLADFRELAVESTEPLELESEQAAVSTPILGDDFSQLNEDLWQVENGDWSVKDGRMVQSNGATIQHRLVSAIKHPRDFRAKLRLRITGGDQYRSVGLGFDGQGVAMKSVYLSVAGGKVQFTSQGENGRWQYPSAGSASHPIELGQDYFLELIVKNQLLNVLIDGELKLAYNLPQRQAGNLSVWAFSATAEFDQLDVTTLPAGTELAAAGNSADSTALPTRQGLQLALEVSEAAEAVAVEHHKAMQSAIASLQARIAAETVKYGLAEGKVQALVSAAGYASHRHAIDQLAEQVAASKLSLAQMQQKLGKAADGSEKKDAKIIAEQKKMEELQQKLVSAEEQLDNGLTDYAPLGPQYPKTSTGRRLAFANWIANFQNPLTARVLVNHVWLRHFGVPLVERTFDFGLRSERPQHADLLDWLAIQFMADGWSLKKLHKQILMSGLYRRSSSSLGATAATLAADPDNLAMWRMNARRMEAEVVRDSVLHLGGSLDLKMGGPPVEHTQGQSVLRRSLYFRQDKERQMTFLSVFDGAKVNECYERNSTVAPQQALALFNSEIAAGQASKIAEMYAGLSQGELVTALFEHVLCRDANAKEIAECLQFLSDLNDSPEARRQLALVLLNHNEFVTIR